MAELGGNHTNSHKLMYDTPVGIRDQRTASPDDTASKSNGHAGGQGSGSATNEEASNEDDEEDSSSVQDEQEDEDEDPDTLAPSRGRGKGKGKRPVIRVEPADADESQAEDEHEPATHETGPKLSKHPVSNLLMNNKKRTFSNVSNTSVLFGEDQSEDQGFPRRKMARKLSNSGFKPLLKYKESATENMDGSEHAIETDDEDYSGVNLVPEDDDSDMEGMEQQEESFIIQDEEHHATALISQFNDARRLSLDSHASDDIFNLTTPFDDSFGVNNIDLGFARFFEPPPLPTSPEVSKRKFSDSSTKRVRFDDEVQMSDSSSTSSSELDSSLYPDLFLAQDKLPPSLSQLLETDHDEDNGDYDSPGSDMSFWDFAQDEVQSNPHVAPEADESSDAGSSGYESMLMSCACAVFVTNMTF